MKKQVLIVDDSALMRKVISDIIKSDDQLAVKDIAINGMMALELIKKNHLIYDVVLLDINMPKMDGLELLSELQKQNIRAKVVMVSTVTKEGAKETILALERGAFDFVTKPENHLDAQKDTFKDRLLEMIYLATGLRYTKQLTSRTSVHANIAPLETSSFNTIQKNINQASHKRLLGNKSGKSKLVALACSTGGPKSLQRVIPLLPKNLNAPVLIVQHMPKGFTESLATRLNEMSQVKVKEASHGDVLQNGYVYIAPGGKHMKVVKSGTFHKIITTDDPPIGALRPCADVMYESLMEASYDEITCVVLTGMGADGTKGIGKLGKDSNIYVIAQDEESCVVYGMPKAIAKANLVDEVVPLDQVANAITKNIGLR